MKEGKLRLSTAFENFVQAIKAKIIEINGDAVYERLLQIIRQCKVFGTPDLVAKFYLEKGDLDNYRVLKALISNYFRESENSPDLTGMGFDQKNLDRRVVPFFTTIVNNGKIPENIRIISWNYDKQNGNRSEIS